MTDGNAVSATRDFVLGIDFGGTKIALATAALDGELLESDRLETDAAAGAMQAVERAFARAQELVLRQPAENGDGRCVAVSAVSPGIVFEDRVALAPNVPGWEELQLPALLRERFAPTRAAVGTDVKAAAVAELRWGSLRGADPAILLILGTGIAAAIVVAGEVIQGANGAAGEIGYSLRGADNSGAAEGHAPLEEFAGGRAIGERASELFGTPITAAEVFEHPDPRAGQLLEETLDALAVQVANMAIVVDPARIAVGGGLMSQPDPVLAAFERRLRASAPFPPELVPAQFIHDGPLRGAIALALDAKAASTPVKGAA